WRSSTRAPLTSSGIGTTLAAPPNASDCASKRLLGHRRSSRSSSMGPGTRSAWSCPWAGPLPLTTSLSSRQAKLVRAIDLCRIDFEPIGKRIDVPVGTSLLEAARRAGVGLASICGGEGTCGRCRLVVMAGTVSPQQSADRQFLSQLELDAGQRLACRAHARSDVKVAVPKASLVTDQRLQVGGLAHTVTVEA